MEPTLYLRKLAIISPPDSNLPAAQRERAFLLNLIQQQHLQDASPVEPTRPLVNLLLQDGSYDWFHVAGHGNFHLQNPEGASAIWLKGNLPLTVDDIVGDAEISISKQRPAFFFNACETGRQGWSLTGMGGWAERLVSAGASLFLAPQWSVNDGASLLFCKEVYRSLLEGKTVAEAVRQGRLTARRAGGPTWLAYSLYAHPNARLSNFPPKTKP
jgi:CHAT domain-containing protein